MANTYLVKMQSRTACIVTVLVGWVVFAVLDLGGPVAVAETTDKDEHKILSDCKHSDYRTYVQCLIRHRRHHGSNNMDFG